MSLSGSTKTATSSASTINSTNLNSADNMIVNMRVTANSSQGHRKYMEDCYKIRFQRDTTAPPPPRDTNSNKGQPVAAPPRPTPQSDILFSYFGIFDGHGGKEAAQYCKEKLFWAIIESDDFWSDNDTQILAAIRQGFVKCHLNMWDELPEWPATASGLPSTSGTTATVLFIKKSKAYVGHVGDSGLVIGYTKGMTGKLSTLHTPWYGKKLTRDHKPEDPIELKRIENLGGSVMTKSGVNRVVWNRPVLGSTNSCSNLQQNAPSPPAQTASLTRNSVGSVPYQMNYMRNQNNVPTEKIPFLAVARSLGDLWSYEMKHDDFLVSPVPDVFAFDLDPRIHKCLILATDGLWNVLKASECVEMTRQTDRETEQLLNRTMQQSKSGAAVQPFVNPSQKLVNTAIQRCCEKMIRADNTTCITIMLDQQDDDDEINDLTLNRTSFDRLISNKTIEFSRRHNDSDDFEDAYDEIDDDDDDEDNGEEASNKRRLTKTLSGQMLNASEFNTPLAEDKRSRSLISLRRRHWSASSNRSSSTVTTSSSKQQQQPIPQVKKNFINIEDRSRRKLFQNNPNSNSNNHLVNATFMPKNSSNNFHSKSSLKQPSRPNLNSTEIYPRQPSSRSDLPSSNRYNQGGGDSNVTLSSRYQFNNTVNSKPPRHQASNLNTTSATNLTSMSRASKNLRKSFNDLCSATANKLNSTFSRPQSVSAVHLKRTTTTATSNFTKHSEENLKKFEKMCEKRNREQPQQLTIGQKYTKRLKGFKQRLLKTKNILFGRAGGVSERKSDSPNSGAQNSSDQENKNVDLSNATLSGQNEVKEGNTEILVSSVKFKFMKKSKNNCAHSGETLNSTALSAKLSNTYLGNASNKNSSNKHTSSRMQHQIYEASPNKRPKFY